MNGTLHIGEEVKKIDEPGVLLEGIFFKQSGKVKGTIIAVSI